MTQPRISLILAFSCILAPLTGCDSGGGDDDGSTTNATMTDPTAGDSTGDLPTTGDEPTTGGAVEVDYVTDIQPIWDAQTNGCVVGCHVAGGFAAYTTVLLDPANSHKTMVGVMSLQATGLMIVKPGDAANSYLWHKLNDTHLSVNGIGTKMPQTGMLTADQLALIKAWIDAGAQM